MKAHTYVLVVETDEAKLFANYPNYRRNFSKVSEFLTFLIANIIPRATKKFGYSVSIKRINADLLNSQKYTKEVSMVCAVIADNITKKLYEKCGSYIDTIDLISEWGIEFAQKHKNTNWEKVLEKNPSPLSDEVKSIMCWDDAVIDFAHYKLNNFNA